MASDWGDYNYGQQQGGGANAYGGFYDGGYGQVAAVSAQQPTFMTPAPVADDAFGGQVGADEFADEPPLLEELGINVGHIAQKTLAVLNPFRATPAEAAGDGDLAGPLVFCLAFGSLLLLSGKVHFNYIYGIGVLGCLAMYALLALMAVGKDVHFTVVVSVLGYCILPVVVLSAVSVVFSLSGAVGNMMAVAAVGWCAASASKLFVQAFGMEHQQLLVAYPCSLLYAVFALITIF